MTAHLTAHLLGPVAVYFVLHPFAAVVWDLAISWWIFRQHRALQRAVADLEREVERLRGVARENGWPEPLPVRRPTGTYWLGRVMLTLLLLAAGQNLAAVLLRRAG